MSTSLAQEGETLISTEKDDETTTNSTSEETPTNVYDWHPVLGDAVQMKIISPQTADRSTLKQSEHGDLTYVSIKGSLTPQSSSQSTTPFEIYETYVTVGDGEIVQGLELVIRFMKQGEASHAIINSKYAYGSHGNDTLGIPPDSTIYYEVELVRITCVDDFTIGDYYKKAASKKTLGNVMFKRKDYISAAKLYAGCVTITTERLDDVIPDESGIEVDSSFRTLSLSSLLNLSRTYYHLKNLPLSKETCIAVLKIDKNNITAMILVSRVCVDMGDFNEALVALENAGTVEVDSAHVKKGLEYMKIKEMEYNKTEKMLAKKMAGGVVKKGVGKEKKEVEQPVVKPAAAAQAAAPAPRAKTEFVSIEDFLKESSAPDAPVKANIFEGLAEVALETENKTENEIKIEDEIESEGMEEKTIMSQILSISVLGQVGPLLLSLLYAMYLLYEQKFGKS